MKKAGDMYVIDEETYFAEVFEESGDRFEIGHLKRALEHVTNFRTAIDGGANYGSWSRYLAQQFDTVHAFEPVADIYECLVENTKEFENITTYEKALGKKASNVTVGKGKEYHNTGCSTVIGGGKVQMITLDSLELEDVDLLKLDIEGYEFFALTGAKELLERCKPIVIFEENRRSWVEHNIRKHECRAFLQSVGYEHLDSVNKDIIYGPR